MLRKTYLQGPFLCLGKETPLRSSFEVIQKCSKEPHRHCFSCLFIFLVICPWWVTLLCPCWRDLFETVSLGYYPYHLALHVYYHKFVVLPLPDCRRLLVFLHFIVDSMNFFLSVECFVLQELLKVDVVLIYIKLNTCLQYVLISKNGYFHYTRYPIV